MKRFMMIGLALLLATTGFSGENKKPAGTVISVSGKVTLTSSDSSSGGLKAGQPVYAGDRIQTGANGRAQVVLSDGTQLKVNYLTDLTLRDTDTKGKQSERGIGSIKLALGQLWAKVTKKNSRLEFETPAAVAAVKGTEPSFDVDPSGNLCIKLKEGKLDLSGSKGGSASMGEMQQICVMAGKTFSQDQVKAWDGKGLDWAAQLNNMATSGTISVETDHGTINLKYQKQSPEPGGPKTKGEPGPKPTPGTDDKTKGKK